MCFKCTECNMTLNMKNYKGYNKMPYCNAYVYKYVASVTLWTVHIKHASAHIDTSALFSMQIGYRILTCKVLDPNASNFSLFSHISAVVGCNMT